MIHDILYKIDSKGKVRSWCIEQEDDAYRTIAGIKDGKMVTSAWSYGLSKNAGRANETTPHEQASAEVLSIYTKKLEKDYYASVEEAGTSRFFVPMTAKKWSDLAPKAITALFRKFRRVYSQPKLDGVRCIADRHGLWTRGGKKIVTCPHIEEELVPFFEKHPEERLDGELYNHELRNNFNRLISLIKRLKPTERDLEETRAWVEYHVYDSTSSLEFHGRNLFVYFELKSLFHQIGGHSMIKQVPTLSASTDNVEQALEYLEKWYSEYLQGEYEGQMVRFDGPYESKRSGFLWKNKLFFDAEFEIVSINEGTGNWQGKAKSVTMIAENGNIFDAGIKGTAEEMERLFLRKDEVVGKYATVRYQNLTPDRGVPRIGIVHHIHETDRW